MKNTTGSTSRSTLADRLIIVLMIVLAPCRQPVAVGLPVGSMSVDISSRDVRRQSVYDRIVEHSVDQLQVLVRMYCYAVLY